MLIFLFLFLFFVSHAHRKSAKHFKNVRHEITDQFARHENAGRENATVENTRHERHSVNIGPQNIESCF